MLLALRSRYEASGSGGTATNESFYPTGTSGQLQIGGIDVVSSAVVSSIVRTDWCGAYTLSLSARTNRVTSNVATGWTPTTAGTATAAVITSGFTGPDGASSAYRVQLNKGAGTTSSDLCKLACPYSGTTAGQLMAEAIWIKSNTGETQNLTLTGNGPEPYSHITATTTWQRFTINGATDVFGGTTGNISLRLQGDLQPTWNTADVLVAFATVEQGVSVPSATIPVGSITDYSVTGSGAVTLGQTASGIYVWTGTGTLAATGTTLNCPAPSGMTMAGLAAALVVTLVAPTPAGITFAPLNPSIQQILAAPVASVALAGLAPSLAQTIQAPAPPALTLAGLAPTLSAGSVTLVCPAPASMSLAALAPTIQQTLASPAPVALALSGTAPTLTRALVAPAPTMLALAGLSPALAQSLACPAPSVMTLAGLAPTLQVSGTLICPAPTSIALTGTAPALVATLQAPAPAALTLATLAPSLARGLACPSPAAITLAGTAPALSRSLQAPVAVAMTLVGYAPALLTSTVIQCPAPASIALASLAPSLRVTIIPTTGVMTLQGLAPSLLISGQLITDPAFIVKPGPLDNEVKPAAVASAIRPGPLDNEVRPSTVVNTVQPKPIKNEVR